jgi:hypothetical protein
VKLSQPEAFARGDGALRSAVDLHAFKGLITGSSTNLTLILVVSAIELEYVFRSDFDQEG